MRRLLVVVALIVFGGWMIASHAIDAGKAAQAREMAAINSMEGE